MENNDSHIKRLNKDQQSVLHTLSFMQDDHVLVEFIWNMLSEESREELLLHPDVNGDTPLLLEMKRL